MTSIRRRNQLIGFIILILFVTCVVSYFITDKSKLRESTVSLLPSNDDVLIQDVDSMDSLGFVEPFAPIEDSDDNQAVIHQTEIVPPNNGVLNSTQQTDKNYIVQLVALKNKQKIEELVALLRLNNYDVYTVPQIPKDGQSTRLLVGHYPTREQAEIVIIDLQNLTKLKGIIVTK